MVDQQKNHEDKSTKSATFRSKSDQILTNHDQIQNVRGNQLHIHFSTSIASRSSFDTSSDAAFLLIRRIRLPFSSVQCLTSLSLILEIIFVDVLFRMNISSDRMSGNPSSLARRERLVSSRACKNTYHPYMGFSHLILIDA